MSLKAQKNSAAPPTGTVQETQDRTIATRRALLLTAERLYARLGVDGVSLREINREAQQRNRSAVHYHFGSREAVIEGIFEMRAAQIDVRRRQLLAELRAKGSALTLRELVEGVIRPQAEVWQREAGSYHYNRFLAQAVLSGHDELRDMWRQRFGGGLREYWAIFKDLLPDVPDSVLRQRFAVATDFAIYGLANLERVVELRRAAKTPFSFDRAFENLIDMLAAAISVAPSAKTLSALVDESRSNATARRTKKPGVARDTRVRSSAP